MSEMRGWGHLPGSESDRLVVVSPHLDDAVLGASHLIAAHPGATVVTVFAGRPAAYPDPPTRWDALAGFGVSEDVLATRRAEDAAALAELGARPRPLDFVEHQYLAREDWVGPEAVVTTLATVLRELDPNVVAVPFGLANPDHVCAHDAAMLVREARPELTWLCYEDTGYKHIPGLLAWRVARLFRAGVWPTPVAPVGQPDPELRRAALEHYASQLLALEADWALSDKLAAPEQVWRLAPPPEGWDRLQDS
jgi:LmbE family N-acetylglucosaminyl deacetylase